MILVIGSGGSDGGGNANYRRSHIHGSDGDGGNNGDINAGGCMMTAAEVAMVAVVATLVERWR